MLQKPHPRRATEPSLTASALTGLAVLASALVVVSVSGRNGEAAGSVESHAREYLRLVADLGGHDPDSVDFDYAKARPTSRPVRPLAAIATESHRLAIHLRQAGHHGDAERILALAEQLDAVAARAEQLSGSRLTFDKELTLLFGLQGSLAPSESAANERARLMRLLPGDDPLPRRLASYQRRFSVPRGRLHAAVTRSIQLCRERTRQFLALPPGETVSVEYVVDKPWSGYSVYLGHYRSVVQVNRGLSLSIDDVLTLACHEGYPGHHVYNSLREEQLVLARGRTELRALPLFSPEGFRAEAVTSAATSIVFSASERAQIFRDVLFPLVGLDSSEASRYAQVCEVVDRMVTAAAHVLQTYLAGDLRRVDAREGLRDAAAMEHPDALLAYADRYRGYSLAYTAGRNRFLTVLKDGRDQREQWTRLRQLIVAGTSLLLPETIDTPP